MTFIKAFIPALAGLFLAAAAFGGDVSTPPLAPGAGPVGCRGGMRYLTVEERLMHFQEMHKDIGTMTINQFRDWRNTQCTTFANMTPAERKSYAEGLDAKWNALSDGEKLKLYHQAMEWRGTMGRGMGRGWR
jgi:hypothetical protein